MTFLGLVWEDTGQVDIKGDAADLAKRRRLFVPGFAEGDLKVRDERNFLLGALKHIDPDFPFRRLLGAVRQIDLGGLGR